MHNITFRSTRVQAFIEIYMQELRARTATAATFTEVLKFVICYVPMPGTGAPQVNLPWNTVFPALILLF